MLIKNFIFDSSNFTGAYIAQLAEHFHGKEGVASSILAVGTKSKNYLLKLKIFSKHYQKYFCIQYSF